MERIRLPVRSPLAVHVQLGFLRGLVNPNVESVLRTLTPLLILWNALHALRVLRLEKLSTQSPPIATLSALRLILFLVGWLWHLALWLLQFT